MLRCKIITENILSYISSHIFYYLKISYDTIVIK